MEFIQKDVRSLSENFVKLVGDDYALITVKDDKKINMMTASWGFFGVIWNKNAVCFVVRPSRYTYNYLISGDRFTINFLSEGNKEILSFCGTKSGRDCNKVKETGLTPIEINDDVLFSQSKLAFSCKKLYSQEMNVECFNNADFGQKMYPQGDIHTMFIAEIEKVYIAK